MINTRYTQWILEVVGDCKWEQTKNGLWRVTGSNPHTTVDGEPLIQRCDVAAPLMAKKFPELTVVYGTYRHPVSTHNVWMYHVWCRVPNGIIVDPTGRQFDVRNDVDSYTKGEYSLWLTHNKEER